MPRHRGGSHTWDNLVTACKACNHRKGGKLLEEARLRLARRPFEPRCDVYSLFTPVPARRSQRELAHLPLPRPLAEPTGQAPDRSGDAARATARIPAPVAELLGDSLARRPGGLRRGRLPARLAAGPRAGGLGPDDRRAAGAHPGALPAFPVREPLRDGGGAARRGPVRDHGLPARRLLFRPPPARPRGVRQLDRGGPGPARLHRQRDGLGRRTRRAEPRSSIRTAAATTWPDGCCEPSATRTCASTRTPCA